MDIGNDLWRAQLKERYFQAFAYCARTKAAAPIAAFAYDDDHFRFTILYDEPYKPDRHAALVLGHIKAAILIEKVRKHRQVDTFEHAPHAFGYVMIVAQVASDFVVFKPAYQIQCVLSCDLGA
ncbi:hypothetical protein SDC9_170931 [bioreactor metagenome]|uniref:Uncharacterized protein n=1 Tax=bioreactor metagenome TaxID=1076179 RepID=A0A645GC31_9ZZZZ